MEASTLTSRARTLVRSSALLRAAVRLVRALVSFATGTALTLSGAATLLRRRSTIAASEVFVMVDEGGFGHTIAAPDIARRLFPDRRVTFLIFSGKGRYNRWTDSIWSDRVRVIFVAIELKRFWMRNVPALARRYCERRLSPGARRYWTVVDLYRELDALHPAEAAGFPQRLNIAWTAAYFALISRTAETAPPALAEATMAAVATSLALAPGQAVAHLYLRQKDGGDVTSMTRSGSAFEAYMPAVRFLQERGYHVLITGDVLVPPDCARRLAPVVDRAAAARAGIDGDLFQLFAPLRASICISESGGGAWLPMILGKPHLCVNAYPYFYAMRDAWMFPKRLANVDGRPVEPERLFSEFLFCHQVAAGLKLLANGSAEILAAVREFIEHVEAGDKPARHAHPLTAGRGWYPSSGAAICRSWFPAGSA